RAATRLRRPQPTGRGPPAAGEPRGGPARRRTSRLAHPLRIRAARRPALDRGPRVRVAQLPPPRRRGRHRAPRVGLRAADAGPHPAGHLLQHDRVERIVLRARAPVGGTSPRCGRDGAHGHWRPRLPPLGLERRSPRDARRGPRRWDPPPRVLRSRAHRPLRDGDRGDQRAHPDLAVRRRWARGSAGDPGVEQFSSLQTELGTPLVTVVVFGAIWIFYRRVVSADASRETEKERAANVRRVYTYLIAAIGLAMLAIGLAGIIGVLGSIGMGINTHTHSEIATYGALVILGTPAWAFSWWQARRRLDDDERRS